MSPDQLKRLKELETANTRLKRGRSDLMPGEMTLGETALGNL